MDVGALLAAALLAFGLVMRAMIVRASAGSAVDQNYWLLVARAYREQRGLPVRLPGSYLMEDETQAYPPLFGLLLGRMPVAWRPFLTAAIEVVELVVIVAALLTLGVPPTAVALAAAAYVAGPVLVVYNAQLTPRVLGDFFLFGLLMSQVAAVHLAPSPAVAVGLWVLSGVLFALAVMTHKMTVQLFVVLLPLWTWVLGTWLVPVSVAGGMVVYVALVGWRFACYQFKAHWDIVIFWNRHWRDLGAHQFRHSSIYGQPGEGRGTLFHAPGLRGAVRHLRLVVAYAPLNVVLPLASLASGVWPPDWLLVWLGGTYAWALGTLYVPWLKCLGGGHLYIFNAVAPGALYVGFLPLTGPVLVVISLGMAMTVVALALAWRQIRRRPTTRSGDFDRALEAVKGVPRGRFGVFPLQAAEAVASATHHAVLWGGHGYGFGRLEGFFPVLHKPVSDFLRQYEIGWILWDSSFWPEGEARLNAEGALTGDVQRFGSWCLARCPMGPSQRVETSAGCAAN